MNGWKNTPSSNFTVISLCYNQLMLDKTLVLVTGNLNKFQEAQEIMNSFGIKLEQVKVSIDEIQSDSPEEVTIDKAKKAYEVVKKPLFVNDSGWIFTALNGFPGPFMKHINHWFSPEDFIALMSRYDNKEVILRETIVFTDGNIVKVFKRDIRGTILAQPKGDKGVSSDKVISLSPNGRSISETYDDPSENNGDTKESIWKDFATWFAEDKSNLN